MHGRNICATSRKLFYFEIPTFEVSIKAPVPYLFTPIASDRKQIGMKSEDQARKVELTL